MTPAAKAWRVFDTLNDPDDDVLPVVEIREGDDFIASVVDIPQAELIVRAVNAHEDLVRSLRDAVSILDAIRKYGGDAKFKTMVHKPTVTCMHQAIAKAEGRS